MLLGALAATLLRHLLSGKETRVTSKGQGIIRTGHVVIPADEGTARVGRNF